MNQSRKSLTWINPLAHNVYRGWLDFWNRFYDLRVYDGQWLSYGFVRQNTLECSKSFQVGVGNFFNFYKSPKNLPDGWIVVVGDIFTNSLCASLRWRNVVCYSEFFLKPSDGWKKRAIFFMAGFLFWWNRKILVPTRKAEKTFLKISRNVFYLPQLYAGEIHKNTNLDSWDAKILYLGHNIDDPKKNVGLLLECFVEIHKKYPNVSLTLVWGKNSTKGVNESEIRLWAKKGISVLDQYSEFLQDGSIRHIPFVPHENVSNMYLEHNIFILPSFSDPIGAVVLEAMAHWLPIVVSDNVGAADYAVDWKNSHVFKSGDLYDFQTKLELLVSDPKKRKAFGSASNSIVKECHWIWNAKLLDRLNDSFKRFTS